MNEEQEEYAVCDVCGIEEEDWDEVDNAWISFSKLLDFEVLVCPDCALSKSNLEEAFKSFLGQLEASKMEKH